MILWATILSANPSDLGTGKASLAHSLGSVPQGTVYPASKFFSFFIEFPQAKGRVIRPSTEARAYARIFHF